VGAGDHPGVVTVDAAVDAVERDPRDCERVDTEPDRLTPDRPLVVNVA
jgi:hypothetical protein